MSSPWFLFGSLSLHVVLIGVLIFAGTVSQRTPLPISKPVLEASLWVQPHHYSLPKTPRTDAAKQLVSEAPLLAKNMQEGALGGSFSHARRRRVQEGKPSIVDALYLDGWKRKVERVGNLNYPAEARRLGLSGSLRLRVLLTQDGSLAEATVLSSSGEAILDEAALKIVHLAAPFAPFPPAMRKEADVLEIVRTWQFLGSRELVM